MDRVLVDAPCSGVGSWRRKPDARWSGWSSAESLAELGPRQAAILERAARLVKPGGRLVYATCSLLPQENERQVEAFLASPEGRECWQLGTPSQDFAGPLDDRGFMKLSPASTQTDGFFAAVLERSPEAKKAPGS